MTDEQDGQDQGLQALGPMIKEVVETIAKKRLTAPGPIGEEPREGERCPVCHGYERISVHAPGDPVHSTYRDCPGPVCQERRAARALARLEGTQIADYARATFESFYPRPAQRAAWDMAQDFAQREPPYGLLYLVGSNAAGKTHLAAAVARAVAARGHSALFYRTTTLLDEIRASYDPEAPGTRPLMTLKAKLRDVRCLVLDDFGQERMTKWSEEIFFDLLDHRYSNWRERATVITSNTPLSALAESLGSRLVDVMRSKVCLLLGDLDLRVLPLYEDGVVHAAAFDMGAPERREHAVKEGVRICPVCNCLPCHDACPWTKLRVGRR